MTKIRERINKLSRFERLGPFGMVTELKLKQLI